MKITVFGATGNTGKLLVKQTLETGYEVVAYVRNPFKLTTTDNHLTVIQGELTDATSVETAIKGSDAVLSTLGSRDTGEIGAQTSRADIADFMLKQIDDPKYIRQAPAIRVYNFIGD